ncbi:MAG: RidA family protein [Phycisphaeraceae bacterium]|nr:RidA family protein [Phycisphaerae bacterium]MBX3392189.1 RidA family protein [Phycisphaeraceae bacterium]
MNQPAPTTDPESRLLALGLSLPVAPKPVAAYIPTRRAGDLLFVSGQIPLVPGPDGSPTLLFKGAVPDEVSMEQAQECARRCVLNGLAAMKAAVGSLACLRQVVRVGVFVCSRPGFFDQPKVANAASELLMEVFGDAGRHARAAVGSIALPLGAPVEIEFIVEIDPACDP